MIHGQDCFEWDALTCAARMKSFSSFDFRYPVLPNVTHCFFSKGTAGLALPFLFSPATRVPAPPSPGAFIADVYSSWQASECQQGVRTANLHPHFHPPCCESRRVHFFFPDLSLIRFIAVSRHPLPLGCCDYPTGAFDNKHFSYFCKVLASPLLRGLRDSSIDESPRMYLPD